MDLFFKLPIEELTSIILSVFNKGLNRQFVFTVKWRVKTNILKYLKILVSINCVYTEFMKYYYRNIIKFLQVFE